MRFAAACIDHARAQPGAEAALLADAADALHGGYPAVAAYAAAVAVAHDDEAAYAAERRRQSAWIVRELVDRL